MIEPTISRLLDRTAEALTETVDAELEPGSVRTQVKAAIAVMRRAAHAFDLLAPTLDADIQDIIETLRSLELSDGLRERIEETATPCPGFPTVIRLSAVHKELQEILIDVPDSSELRGLFRRMVERERTLNNLY